MPVKLKKENSYPIRFTDPRQSVSKTFKSGDEIRDYIGQEQAFWNATRQRTGNSELSHIPVHAGGNAVRDAEKIASTASSAEQFAAALQVLLKEKAILSEGRFGGAIAEDGTANQVLGRVFSAAAALGNLGVAGNRGNNGVDQRTLAVVTAGLWTLNEAERSGRAQRSKLDGLIGELEEEKAALEEERHAFAEWVSKQKGDWEAHVTQAREEVSSETGQMRNSVGDAVSKAHQRLQGMLGNADEELEEFKRKVRQDVVNEVPTTFWNDKAEGHRNTAIGFGILFLAIVVGTIFWIDSYAIEAVVAATNRLVGTSDSPTLVVVPLALITVPALTLAWTLRHVSRVIVQNLSLNADARLRGTITSTFRALAEDRSMSEAELALALQALFRPIDGKDHTDIAPPSLADILKIRE